MCGLSNLDLLHFQGNDGISCYAACLDTIAQLDSGNILACPTDQDEGLCGFIAATDITSKSGYEAWSCNVSGLPSSDPCNANGSSIWDGLVCNGTQVISLVLTTASVSGKLLSLSTKLPIYLVLLNHNDVFS